MNIPISKCLSFILALLSFTMACPMKREPADQTPQECPEAKRQSSQQQQPVSGIDEVFQSPYLLNYLASFLPPADACRFAQVNRATRKGCSQDAEDQEKYLVYQKMAAYLIENSANPVRKVQNSTNAAGIATINGITFHAGQLIDTLLSLGAQICRIANYRKNEQTEDSDFIWNQYTVPSLKPIPSCDPTKAQDVDHGKWIVLTETDWSDYWHAYAQKYDLDDDEKAMEKIDCKAIITCINKAYDSTKPAGIVLDLSDTYITRDLLSQLAQFPIVSLAVSDNNISEIDFADFAKLTELKELFVAGQAEVPRAYSNEDLKKLCTLTHLQALVLGGGNITSIPEEIAQLKELRYLYLKYNPITNLEHIGSLKNLRGLFLSHVPEIPDSIQYLKHLRNLTFNHTEEAIDEPHRAVLKTINPLIGSLRRLKRLNLLDQEITEIPESLKNLRHLEELYIGNPIARLPRAIAHLPKLKHTNLADDSQTIVPMSYLRLLAYNKLTDFGLVLPKSFYLLFEHKEALKNMIMQHAVYIFKPENAALLQALEMFFTDAITVEAIKTLINHQPTLISLLKTYTVSQPEPLQGSTSYQTLEECLYLQREDPAEWTQCLDTELNAFAHSKGNPNLLAILRNIARRLHIEWKSDAMPCGNPEIMSALLDCWDIMQRFYDDMSHGMAITAAHIQSLEQVLVTRPCQNTRSIPAFQHNLDAFLVSCLLIAIGRNEPVQVATIVRHRPLLATMHISHLGTNLVTYVENLAKAQQEYQPMLLCIQRSASTQH